MYNTDQVDSLSSPVRLDTEPPDARENSQAHGLKLSR
jgi:hypothetical protein